MKKLLISRDEARINQVLIAMNATAKKATQTLKAISDAYPTEHPTMDMLLSFYRNPLKFVADRVKGYPATFDVQRAIQNKTVVISNQQRALLSIDTRQGIGHLLNKDEFESNGWKVLPKLSAVEAVKERYSKYAETPEQLERMKFLEYVEMFAKKNGLTVPQLIKEAYCARHGRMVKIDPKKVEWIFHGKDTNPPRLIAD